MRRATTAVAGLLLLPPALAGQDQATLALARAYLEARTPASDDADARGRALLEAAGRESRSPLAVLLVRAARDLVDEVRDPLALARAAQSVGAAADAHGLAASEAQRLQAAALLRAGGTAAALELRRGSGHADAVLVLGPFGDDGDHYLGVAFPPEFGLDGGPWRGRYGPVAPRVAQRRLQDEYGAIRLREPAAGRHGCYYALHQVASDSARACYLEVFSPGSFEVFVNGELVARHDAFAASSHFLHWVPIVLRAGHNHVLAKTVLNGFDDLALRYVDAAGRLVPVRQAPAGRIEPCADAPGDAPPRPGAFATPLLVLDRAAQAAQREAARVLRAAAALAATEHRAHAEALGHLLALQDLGPGDADVTLAAGAAFAAVEALPEETRRSRARALLEPLFATLPEHAWLLRQRAAWLADEDKGEEAIRLLQGAVAAGRAGAATFARLHDYCAKLEFAAEATRAREAWRAAFPGDAAAALAEARERQRDGDHRGALAVLQAARKAAPGHRELTQRTMLLAAEAGDGDLARRALAELHALDPGASAAAIDRAEVEERLGQADAAAAAWRQVAAHQDATAAEKARAARAFLALAADAAAVEALAVAIAMEPAQHEARRLWRRLTGATPDFPALAPFRREAAPLVAAFEPGEQEATASATLLLDQMVVEVLPDGSAVHEIHQVRRINDQAGVERYQQAEEAAAADEVVALRTIGRDGRTYVPNRVERSFAMPRLEPGAFVEAHWRRFERAPGAEPWRTPVFQFQSEDEPFGHSELVVILPPEHPGTFRVRNFAGEPATHALPDGRTAHVFVRRDVPRLTPEKLAPPLAEVVPLVAYGSDRRPGALARRARDHLAFRTRGSPLVEAKARELTAGIAGDAGKAAAVHAFVHGEIPSGGGASDPTAVLVRRRGSRFWLEVALLRAAGVPLRLAACAHQHEAFDREPRLLFAGDERWELDAARIEPRDGPPRWLFADAPRHWPLGEIPVERLGAAAVLLEVGSWQSLRLPGGDPRAAEGVAVAGVLELDAKGDARCQVELTVRGADGFNAADQLRQRDDNVRKLAARQIASQLFPGWRADDVQLDLVETGRPLRARGELRKAGAVAGGDALLESPLARGDWLARFGDRAERTQPLLLTTIGAASWEVRLRVAPAFRFVELPADTHVQHELLDYTLTWQRDGDDVVVRREYLQRPGRMPAAGFAEWLRLLRTLDQAEETRLRLVAR